MSPMTSTAVEPRAVRKLSAHTGAIRLRSDSREGRLLSPKNGNVTRSALHSLPFFHLGMKIVLKKYIYTNIFLFCPLLVL